MTFFLNISLSKVSVAGVVFFTMLSLHSPFPVYSHNYPYVITLQNSIHKTAVSQLKFYKHFGTLKRVHANVPNRFPTIF